MSYTMVQCTVHAILKCMTYCCAFSTAVRPAAVHALRQCMSYYRACPSTVHALSQCMPMCLHVHAAQHVAVLVCIPFNPLVSRSPLGGGGGEGFIGLTLSAVAPVFREKIRLI
jgi:hypothetical protein